MLNIILPYFRKSSGGGVTGWLGSWFGSKGSSEAPVARYSSAPDDLEEMCDDERAAPVLNTADAYDVDEGEVQMEQCQRMVQQSVMANNLKSRNHKK